MKKGVVLLAGLSLLGSGCAHTPKEKVAESRPGSEKYVDRVTPAFARNLDSEKMNCPRQVKAVVGESWKVQVAQANACVRQGQWNMVEAIGTQLAEVDHIGPWGAYYLSLSAEQRKDLPRAVWMNELALKKAPNSALLIYQKGRLQWLGKDVAGAQKTLKSAVEREPRLADAQLLLGQLAMGQGDMKEAEKRFRAALDADGRLLPALLGAAEVAILKKDAKLANEVLDQAIFSYPSCAKARVRKAQVLESLDRNIPEALAAYRRLKSLDRERKLDAAVDFDLDGKIRQLEGATAQAAANRLSQSDASDTKKVEK